MLHFDTRKTIFITFLFLFTVHTQAMDTKEKETTARYLKYDISSSVHELERFKLECTESLNDPWNLNCSKGDLSFGQLKTTLEWKPKCTENATIVRNLIVDLTIKSVDPQYILPVLKLFTGLGILRFRHYGGSVILSSETETLKKIFEQSIVKKISTLDLSDNHLVDIPSEIKNLKNLKKLDLSCNFLSTIPSEIGALPCLKTLNVTGNCFHSKDIVKLKEQFKEINVLSKFQKI